jgi:hypothetical protein
MSDPDTRSELLAREDRLWRELHDLVASLPEDRVGTPGYFAEGWSAKDLIAHLGSWLSLGGAALERIRGGTYRYEEFDIDSLNKQFYDAMKDVPFATVRAQATAARNRMLGAWGSIAEGTSEADRWIRKAGPDHYAEHLPRLEEWVADLTDR